MKNIKINIGGKILMVNGLILVIMAGSLFYIFIKLGEGTRVIEDQAKTLTRLQTVIAAARTFNQIRYWVTDLALSWQNESEDKTMEAKEELEKIFVDLEKKEPKLAGSLRPQVDSFVNSMMQAVDAYIEENRVLGNSLVANGRVNANFVDEKFEFLLQKAEQSSNEAGKEVIEGNTQILHLSLILILAATILGASLSLLFARSIVVPLSKLLGSMKGIANGRLNQDKLEVRSQDEIGALSTTYNDMLDAMQEIISQAKDIAEGRLDRQYDLKGDLAEAFGKMTQELKEKHYADIEFKKMAEERRLQADELRQKIDNMLVVVSAAAGGDLTQEITVTDESAIGKMGEGLKTFFSQLSDSIKGISETAGKLALSAKEISSSVQDQASVAAQQSASVTEISSTVEELSASSSQMAENANSVAQISANALHDSERGMTAIESLKTKMDDISGENQVNLKEIVDLGRKSNEIGKVMEIINNIADQTKLIAFNAAIEASSAGEAGKRFGVVAVEIRQLADNVMESTGEIQSKIDEIQQAINRLVINSEQGSVRVKEGTQLAGQTIAELERLVAGAKSTAEAAAQISQSTKQQKTATDQVLTALKEIVSGSRQSSVAIKHTSAVTNQLSEMSIELKAMVSLFKIS